MHCDDDPRLVWRERARYARFHPYLAFEGDRLELGAGELFAWIGLSRGGDILPHYPGGREHARARLACAYARPIDDACFDVLEKAARDWICGDKALAYIRLAHARLAGFDDPELAAYRLFLADWLLDERGHDPGELLKALGWEAPAAPTRKTYDPDEPRVPAGSGETSGQWTRGGASGQSQRVTPASAAAAPQIAALATDVESLLAADVAPEALAALEAFAAGFSAPTLALGLFFVPSPGGSSVATGLAPDSDEIAYRWDRAEGRLTISADTGRDVLFSAQARNGIFYDDNGIAIARATGAGLVIDWEEFGRSQAIALANDDSDSRTAAQVAARPIANDNDPKLCPDPGPDKPHGASDDAKQYQSSVTGLPIGLAVWLNGVNFDGCRPSNGVMIEAKAKYAQFLDKNGNWLPWFEGGEDIEDQLQRESAAAGNRGVEIHVKQEATANRIAELVKNLGLPNVTVIWNPRGERAY